MYTRVHIYIYIYMDTIYTYIYRERERYIDIDIHMFICLRKCFYGRISRHAFKVLFYSGGATCLARITCLIRPRLFTALFIVSMMIIFFFFVWPSGSSLQVLGVCSGGGQVILQRLWVDWPLTHSALHSAQSSWSWFATWFATFEETLR